MWNALAFLSVAYVIICLVAFFLQRSLLFHPTNRNDTSLLVPWEEGGKVVGFCREVDQPDTVWLMMHGNAGQASNRDYVLEVMPPDDALYVMEYPGYGDRPGKPSRAAIDAAAREAYGLLCERYPNTPIGVIGESIGSGPASHLASGPRPPDKIVLIVPFDSLQRVASRHFSFLPVSLLLLDRWDNRESLKNYRGSVQIFGARDDQVIPCEHARNLAESCSVAAYSEINCGHNDWSYSPEIRIRR